MTEEDRDPARRASDPDDLDPRKLRAEPLAITIDGDELSRAIAFGRRHAFIIGLTTAFVTAVIVSALAGYVVGRVVTGVVRHDVGRASVENCRDTSAAARALEKFLTSDANYAGQLGALDGVTAGLERDLSRQVQKLGPILPPRIASDYAELGTLYQKIGRVRVQTTTLWAGAPEQGKRGKRRGPSLAQDALTAIHGHCDRLLSP